MEWNWIGNGMETNGDPAVEVKLNGVEWKQKENGTEKVWRAVILTFGFGNGIELKWKWKRN